MHPVVAFKRPAKATVVNALRRWAREAGAPPRMSDWSEPGGKSEREYPGWPSSSDVLAHLGS
jgi:hypothetical protein